MGFLEYAWKISAQKDRQKTRILANLQLRQPILSRDETGFNISLPIPALQEDATVSFLGYRFPADNVGKAKVGRLFRACVLHLTTHTLMPTCDNKKGQPEFGHVFADYFAEATVKDVYVNACISARFPDKLPDLAFANSLAFARIKSAERILNPATRIMATLLERINIGITKGKLCPEEENAVTQLATKSNSLKEKIMESLANGEIKIDEVLAETAKDITQILESHGPILEASSLPHTEQNGPCSIFPQCDMPPETEIEKIFNKSLETLSGTIPSEESIESCWRKEADAEAVQAFDTWHHQKAREDRILEELKEYTERTRFKSISFPDEDYTQYLRAKLLLSGGSRRLLDSLRIAQDALDEDPGKEMGQLDLNAVIQMIASRKPGTDVFMQDEYLSRSFAWGILFDVSASMKIKSDFGQAIVICVAEATKELLQDTGAWALFAFSDRFYILKDRSEAYSEKVRARIGGLKFDGLTYMPDAIQVAGKILLNRIDEQRFLIVISDGWPYGYSNMPIALQENIRALQQRGVIVIGLGVQTERMKNFFKASSSVYDQKDLVKKFAKVYANASTTALET